MISLWIGLSVYSGVQHEKALAGGTPPLGLCAGSMRAAYVPNAVL